MIIDINDELIEQMVKEQVDKTVRTRIKEMQGNYTSKGYIENLIMDVIHDEIYKLCPNVKDYIEQQVNECINDVMKIERIEKYSKRELVECIVDALLERL